MSELQLLRADHAPALLAFERENRSYFAAHVPDRGDAYFEEFDVRHRALLDEQATGAVRMHVLVDDEGEVLGRFNLVDLVDGGAELGYRVAEKATGRGVASAGVREVCRLAVEEYGLSRLTAATTVDNTGSRTVLGRLGFGAVGSVTLDGRPGVAYELDLTAAGHPDLGGSFGRERSGTSA
ncbi:GNAT family N-acetyltransferase [Streptomyces sp. NPDC001927]